MRAADADPAVSITTSKSPGSSSSRVRKSVAPNCRDRASRSLRVPTTSSSAGDPAFRNWTANMPSVPVPTTATRSPGRAFALIAAAAMQAAGSSRAAAVRSASSGRACSSRAGEGEGGGHRPRLGEAGLLVPVRAQRRLARMAAVADLAVAKALADDLAAGQRLRHPGADRLDRPGPLVARRQRVTDVPLGPVALIDLAVAAADAHGVHAHQGLTGARLPGLVRGEPVLARPLDDDSGAHLPPFGLRCSQPSAHRSKRACCCGNSAAASTSSSTPRPGASERWK